MFCVVWDALFGVVWGVLFGAGMLSEQEFIGIGDEVEEGLEVGFVFSFIQFVVEGSLF